MSDKKKLRIVYMGTPEFAVPGLRVLAANHYDIAAVITAPDKPAGRGLKVQTSAVKDAAVELGIPVLQPINLKDPEFQSALKKLNANLQIVVAFRMLPEAIWNMPSLGTFNLHASLLPMYRGAAPINWAIINGEKETGLTTFFLKHEIDTGDVILQEKEPIHDGDDVGKLYERLMFKGADLILKTVQAIENNEIKLKPQLFSNDLPVAPKIHKETCKINFHQSSKNVRNFIRGLSPYPAAWTTILEKQCKIFEASIVSSPASGKPGEIVSDNKTYLHFNTTDHPVAIHSLQMEGKKRMTIEEFLRGTKL